MADDPTSLSVDELLREVASPTAPTQARVIAEDRARQEAEETAQQHRALDLQFKYAEYAARNSHHQNKARWSRFVMYLMGGMLIFQYALLSGVGRNWLDFTRYEWLLPALLVQNLGQVVSLALVIVKALHDGYKD